ncbi:hypothetical protein F0225_05805 [Vibrio pectenicida]|uniref:Aspartyl/asparaginy/proline hydroxylase domain-containing protein n=1 Tax=Vibrio pectenicida TaxID=62763 RepID=A0A7Y3ZXQ0_9VIBR|nr:aspartyl/asparaginyl beta-hydroxylase domain-containing protein [Vibrio pectenicida]NOH70857.1 hypothetical protein [Vibrio pectenicida]
MVRTRNLVNGQVVPHKDFIQLDDNKDKYIRVLIPLETSLTSYHSDEHYGVFRMRKGDIWQLDASVVHAAYNFGNGNRVILCLDFQYDNVKDLSPEIIFKDKSIWNNDVQPLIFDRASLKDQDIEDFILSVSQSIHSIEDIKQAVLNISSAHVHHDIPINKTYDLLIDSVKNNNDEIYNLCCNMKKYYTVDRNLGERFTAV